ncbi:MAG: type II secretion system protein GspL [Pseudomonadota bacterium]
MSETFILRLRDDGQAEGVAVAADGSLAGRIHAGPLEAVARRVEGRPVRVLVPASDIWLARAELPSVSRSRLARAAPFALEDWLVDEVEDLHFALGERNEAGVACAVVTRARMEGWVAELAEVGVRPRALVPEILALPPPGEGEWTALADAVGGPVAVRTGPEDGFTLEAEALAAVLDGALAPPGGDAVPQRLRLWTDAEDPPALGGTVDCEVEYLREGALSLLATRALRGLNLLQGDYSPREDWSRRWRRWRLPAALAGVALLLHGGLLAADYWALKQESRALKAEAETILEEDFPEIGRVVDPRVQVRRVLEGLQGGGEASVFRTLVSAWGEVAADEDGIELRRLDYRDGTLELRAEIRDGVELDALRTELDEAGIAMEITKERDERVRLQLEEAT